MVQCSVLFVCLGNICRSPAAHALFNSLVAEESLNDYFLVDSCGMNCYHAGEPSDSRMRRTAARYGVRIDHVSRGFRGSDLDNFDLVLGMDQGNVRSLMQHAVTDEQRGRIRLFRSFDPLGRGDVPDPWYGGMSGFEEAWQMIERTCGALLGSLRRELGV